MYYWIHCDNVSSSIGKWLDGVFKNPKAIQIKEGSFLEQAIREYNQALADATHEYLGKSPAQTYVEYEIGMQIGELERHKFFGWISQAEYDFRKREILTWGENKLERIADNNLSVTDLEEENRLRQIQTHLNTTDATSEQVRNIIAKARGKEPRKASASKPHQPETHELGIECPPFDVDVEIKRKKLSRIGYYALSLKVLLIYPTLDKINQKWHQFLSHASIFLMKRILGF
ncbi:MAG: hypothetical protein KME49_22625 [Brasilonema octagenarum HA4186-MV1]|jgi:predicted DNA-binding antitoxin AbrB/MazE fold protein|nr:hypothetical protein [Brasilonema octagenarum HA4186-MV1]